VPSYKHARFSAAPFIFNARRTAVVPPKRPELRCDSTGAVSRSVSSFLTASKIATAAFVRIWRLSAPGELGADLVDQRTGTRHGFVGLLVTDVEYCRWRAWQTFARLRFDRKAPLGVRAAPPLRRGRFSSAQCTRCCAILRRHFSAE
jgi:hypothetical protein